MKIHCKAKGVLGPNSLCGHCTVNDHMCGHREPVDCEHQKMVTKIENTFREGDKVSFSITVKKGSGYTIRSRIGKIENTKGDCAHIKYRGQTYTRKLVNIRHDGQQSKLTEDFKKLAEGLPK